MNNQQIVNEFREYAASVARGMVKHEDADIRRWFKFQVIGAAGLASRLLSGPDAMACYSEIEAVLKSVSEEQQKVKVAA